ncbi:DUF4124 domain-containing protein [Massilia sp. IC2-476]|uniref:DUF4124 domain-containing protein n=1 Tax=Massilia sp. IC2-476 TaxID=2887199 RepID=UPI001D1267E3|nr:DUF4124 domain-containing protein [Massilia sp. IC2-476]MCC2973930.1 DUF4124 domain-containing protein [Massilia sp. IC2-476]
MPHQTAPLRLFAACALLLGSTLAHAQYSWIGENGVRQFSDRPPPPSTPPHKILKAPGRLPAPQAAPAPAAATPGIAKELPDLAQRERDYLKRTKAREEQEKKELVEAQRRRDDGERCDAARQARAQVESGIRISRVNAKGERSFASDQERAEQLARANRILAECH